MSTDKYEDQAKTYDLELGKDLLAYAGLFGFGIFYNRLVAYTNRKHGQHGYTSLLVVFGVFVTLAMLSTRIGAINTLKIAAGFVASGLPMILGDTNRYLEYKQEVAVALARASKARRKGLNDVGQTQTGERQRFTLHKERN
ncbi:MAG: hypothetical protein R2932_56780 [Caldilineaceae bacterium]